jgi:hypothetical protein
MFALPSPNDKDQEHRMSDEAKPQDSAAMSPASAGSHGSNGLVAYYVHGSEYETGCEFEFVTLSLEHAEASGGTVATLVRLTDAEREAVDRVRIAFRDMDHNDMTMQQIEDYEAICDLLERTK